MQFLNVPYISHAWPIDTISVVGCFWVNMLDIVSCPHRSYYTLCKIYILFQALSTYIDEHCFVLAVEHLKTIAMNKTNQREIQENYIYHQWIYIQGVSYFIPIGMETSILKKREERDLILNQLSKISRNQAAVTMIDQLFISKYR